MNPAPGACVDCGNDAYIKLAGDDKRMICAHCFAARGKGVIADRARTPTPEPAGERPAH